MLLRSRSNTLVSVRQVTQRNAGRKTAGIDGEVALTSESRADVAVRVHQSIRTWKPRAVRHVYIPKASNPAKSRPLWRAYLARFYIEHAFKLLRAPSASPPRKSGPRSG